MWEVGEYICAAETKERSDRVFQLNGTPEASRRLMLSKAGASTHKQLLDQMFDASVEPESCS
jgi:hypothetical protein